MAVDIVGPGGTITVTGPVEIANEAGPALGVADAAVASTLGTILARLGEILTELAEKLEPGGAVAVNNWPAAQTVNGTVAVSNPTANPETGLAKEATIARKFGVTDRMTIAVQAATIGDNVLATPAAGRRLRVVWLGMSSSEGNGAEVLAIAKFGAGGDARYRWRMGAPGAFSHWEPLEGAVDEPFIVNLSAAQPVECNLTFEEVVP